MVNVTARVQNPEASQISLTITMPLNDWKALMVMIDAGSKNGPTTSTYPGWAVVAAIKKAVGRLTAIVEEESEDLGN